MRFRVLASLSHLVVNRLSPSGAETPTEVAFIPDITVAARQVSRLDSSPQRLCLGVREAEGGLPGWQLADAGADVLMVNTDGPCYGGCLEDLAAVRATFPPDAEGQRSGPPIVAKDIIIHPVQIAQAVEKGAEGVLLMMCLVRTLG